MESHPRLPVRADLGMFDLVEEVPRGELGRSEQFRDAQHCPDRALRRLAQVVDLVLGMRLCPGNNGLLNLAGVPWAFVPAHEARVPRPLLAADQLGQGPPLVVLDYADDDVPVLARHETTDP